MIGLQKKLANYIVACLVVLFVFGCANTAVTNLPSNPQEAPAFKKEEFSFVDISPSIRLAISADLTRSSDNTYESTDKEHSVVYLTIPWSDSDGKFSDLMSEFPKESGPTPNGLVTQFLDLFVKWGIYPKEERDGFIVTPLLYDSHRQALSFQIKRTTSPLKVLVDKGEDDSYWIDFKKGVNNPNLFKLYFCFIRNIADQLLKSVPRNAATIYAGSQCGLNESTASAFAKLTWENFSPLMQNIESIERHMIVLTPKSLNFVKFATSSPNENAENVWNTVWEKSQVDVQQAVSLKAEEKSASEVAANSLPSVGLVLIQDKKGKYISLGTGFVVEMGIVATNLHVIKGGIRGVVKLSSQSNIEKIAGVLAINPEWDLVLLSVPGLNKEALPLGDDSSVSVGNRIYAIGNPRGLEGTFSEGIVSSVRKDESGMVFQVTSPISEGSSGGPLLNNQGQVIGVAFSTIKDGQNLNFGIPVRYLKTLLGSKPRSLRSLSYASLTPKKKMEKGNSAKLSVNKPEEKSEFVSGASWLSEFISIHPLSSCEPQHDYHRRCFSINDQECQRQMTEFAKTCSQEYSTEIPGRLDKAGQIYWAEKLEGCAQNLFTNHFFSRRLKAPGCE